jgi:hypothetical protein
MGQRTTIGRRIQSQNVLYLPIGRTHFEAARWNQDELHPNRVRISSGLPQLTSELPTSCSSNAPARAFALAYVQ